MTAFATETANDVPAHITPGLSDQALAQVVGSTVEALMGADACSLTPDEVIDVEFSRAATVAMHGEEEATIVVRTDEALARHYAMLMFEQTDDTLAEVDIMDSLLELTNVLGGAAKTLLQGQCSLTLPQVLSDPEEHDHAPCSAAFGLAGGYVQLLMHPHAKPGAA